MYPEYPKYNSPNKQQDIIGKVMANKKMLALVGGGFFAVVLLIGTLMANSGNPTPPKVAAMQAHLTALAAFTDEQEEFLISGPIREENATLGVLLVGAANDIGTAIVQRYGELEPDPETAAANATRLADINASMQTAMTTNTIDQTYQLAMVSELQFIDALLLSYAKKSGSTVQDGLLQARQKLADGRERLKDLEL